MTVTYLPTVEKGYIHPGLSQEDVECEEKKLNEIMDQALAFLADPDPNHPATRHKSLQDRASCLSNNSVANLGIYLFTHAPEVLQSLLCCLPQSLDAGLGKRPIPRAAYETLSSTRDHFNRNTCGLFSVAPTMIIASPLISTSPLGSLILGIVSNLVITATAGVFTYVFSGDIAAVQDGRGKTVVLGGIRVSAIQQVEGAFLTIAEHLAKKWEIAGNDPEKRKEIIDLCGKITEHWDDIFHGIADCGITTEAVKKILTPLSTAILMIRKEAKETFPKDAIVAL